MKKGMHKLQVLVFHAERDAVLTDLQALGLVHVSADADAPAATPAAALREQTARYERVYNTLTALAADGSGTTPTAAPTTAAALVERVEALQQAQQEHRQRRRQARGELARLRPWGDFRWEPVERLERAGVAVSFYGAPRRAYENYNWPPGVAHAIVSTRKDYHYLFVAAHGALPDTPFDRLELPRRDPAHARKNYEAADRAWAEAGASLRALAPARTLLEPTLDLLRDQADYHAAAHSLAAKADGKILLLQGWVPNDRLAALADFLSARKLTYTLDAPAPDEAAPVVLRNARYPSLFEPITRIFQLPNYHEFDLTPVVAVFYPVFFGYCLGDAGYGLLVLLGALVARFTFLKRTPTVAALGMVLGAVTMVLGIVKGGTVFGLPVANYPDVPLLAWLAQFVVVPDDQDYVFNAFNVALMIGIVQILTGVLVAIVRKAYYGGWLAALSTVGKLLIIVGLLTLFLGQMQGVAAFAPYVRPAYVLLAVGVVLVLGFHDRTMALAKRVGAGFLPLYFILTGLLGDSLSYIRLFALGVASSILGLVVNQIGAQIMEGGGVLLVVGVLFLIFGHALNLSLACLGAFVHPLRLTFVEFYNNAEFAGGGEPYQPFRRRVAADSSTIQPE